MYADDVPHDQKFEVMEDFIIGIVNYHIKEHNDIMVVIVRGSFLMLLAHDYTLPPTYEELFTVSPTEATAIYYDYIMMKKNGYSLQHTIDYLIGRY